MPVTAGGLLLAVAITGANRHDSMRVEPILDGLSRVKGRGRGRPRHWPGKLHADKVYDNRRVVRRYLRRGGTSARIARMGVDSSERLGRYRWVIERIISWWLTFRRLSTCYDRSVTILTAETILAITIICARRLFGKDH